MHPSTTSPFYPTVLVCWGSSAAFCYNSCACFCLSAALMEKWFGTSRKGSLDAQNLCCSCWCCVKCPGVVQQWGTKRAIWLMATFFWSVSRIHFIFDHQPPTPPPPRICLRNHTSAIMTHLGQSDLFVCDLPGVNFNNLLRSSLSLCRVSVGLQVISVAPVGGSQRGLP